MQTIDNLNDKFVDAVHKKELIITMVTPDILEISLWNKNQDVDVNPDCLTCLIVNLETNRIEIIKGG